MATLLDEGCEGGSDGANATTSNTDFTGFNPTGSVPVFDDAMKLAGSKSLDCAASGTNRFARYRNGSLITTAGIRFGFRFSSFPAANAILFKLEADATHRAEFRVLTDGTFQPRNQSFAAVGGTASLSVDTWYRGEATFDSANNQMQVKLFAGQSTTSIYDSSVVTGASASFDSFKFGCVGNQTWSGLHIDDVKVLDTESFPGPSATPPAVNAGVDQTIQDYHAATIDATVTGNTGTTTYAWSVISGPSTASAQFSTTTAVDTVFTPAGGAGTYTLQLSVTDDSGTTTDTCTITVTALQASDGVASVQLSTGWTASTGTVSDCLTDSDSGTYVTSSDNPSSLDLKFTMRGIIPPTGNYTLTLTNLGRSGGTGTVDVSLLDTDGSTLIKKVTGTVAPATAADTNVTFLAADITTLTAADWRAGVVILVEATAS